MQNPDFSFSAQGFKYIKTIQNNRQANRSTHLATSQNNPNEKFIIKQFSFGVENSESGWTGYKDIKREMTSLKNLDHPQIPKYLDYFEDNNGLFLVMEFIEGNTLAEARNRISPGLAYDITLQTLDILVYLQNQNSPIIHQDIKTHNLLLSKNNKVHLVDFGLAREDNLNSLSMSSSFAGTIGFITPEMVYQHKTNLTTDIYATAITYFCMLTKTSHENLIEQIDLRTGKPNIKKNLEDVTNHNILNWILKATETDIQKRFANAESALKGLQQFSPAMTKSKIISEDSFTLKDKKGRRKRLPVMMILSRSQFIFWIWTLASIVAAFILLTWAWNFSAPLVSELIQNQIVLAEEAKKIISSCLFFLSSCSVFFSAVQISRGEQPKALAATFFLLPIIFLTKIFL